MTSSQVCRMVHISPSRRHLCERFCSPHGLPYRADFGLPQCGKQCPHSAECEILCGACLKARALLAAARQTAEEETTPASSKDTPSPSRSPSPPPPQQPSSQDGWLQQNQGSANVMAQSLENDSQRPLSGKPIPQAQVCQSLAFLVYVSLAKTLLACG